MNIANRPVLPLTLSALETAPRWVAWQTQDRPDAPGKPTKIPYGPSGREAKANYPDTWGTRAEARLISERLPKPYGTGGTGIELGDLGDGQALGGVDLDTCIDASGAIAAWALNVIERFDSYSEISPSQTGCKVYFLYDVADLPAIRAHLGNAKHGKQFKRAGGDHPPAIELYLSHRFFAVTDAPIDGTPCELKPISLKTILWLLTQAGPAFSGKLGDAAGEKTQPPPVAFTSLPQRVADAARLHPLLAARWAGDWTGLADKSRSGKAMSLGAALKDAGFTFAEMCTALRLNPNTAEWTRDKGEASGNRELQRIWDAVNGAAPRAPVPAMGILSRSRLPAVPLPLHIFGMFWSDWISQAAQGANCPPDYVAIPLLAVTSALIGNSRWARGWQGWAEPPVLWFASVGDPSSGKTSGAGPLMRDVLPFVEQHMARDYPADLKTWQEQESVARAVFRQWEKDVAKAVKNEDSMETPAKPAQAEIPPKPVRPRARVDNATIEKLASILEGLPKGVLFSRDELTGWLLNFGRYSNGGTDRPFWLESYVGGSHTVDRVKHPEPIHVPRLSMAIFGTIQPDKLVLNDADDGLTSRFLWCWPDSRPFRRPSGSADTHAAITALIRLANLQMVNDSKGQPMPSYASLDEAGKAIIEAFGMAMQQSEAASHGLMKSAYGKARGQALRLALVLEWLWWCPTTDIEPADISANAMQSAVDLMTSYFLPMAQRVLGDASIPPEENKARALAQWIARTRPDKINVSAIRDDARLDGLRESADVKAACWYLVEAGWLFAPAEASNRGRPRGDYQVNPALWDLLP